MNITTIRLAAYAATTCVLMILSFWTGTSLGKLKSIEAYDLGFADGWKDALYTRPVSEELEMVCLGLWTATLIERKPK